MSEAFDLDAYFARIGYVGSRTPTLQTLQALHALHPAAIPFENLDPLLRRPVRLDLESLQAKMVGARRGGYCFEQNTLFAAVLESLGFSVTKLAGRVRWMAASPDDPDGPRTHMLLGVNLKDGFYLADVGFGAHLFAAPIRLERGIEQPTPASVLRLIGASEVFTLQTLLPKGWKDIYRFTLEPQLAADISVANWFTSTNPSSRFYSNLLAERLTSECQFTLTNTTLISRHKAGLVDERLLIDAQDFAETLETAFGITLPVDPATIWDLLPAKP